MQPENSNQNQNSSQKYLFKGVFVESKLWRRVDYDSSNYGTSLSFLRIMKKVLTARIIINACAD